MSDACSDEKEVYVSYLYRNWCPLFVTEAFYFKGCKGSRQDGCVTLGEGLALAC